MTNKEAADILEDWIYAPVADNRWNRRFEEIEKALGFKLFYWQKTYIMGEGFRWYGERTAEMLKELLDINAEPLDYTITQKHHVPIAYRFDLMDMREKLSEAGIPTRPVFFYSEEKAEWKANATKKKAEKEEKEISDPTCNTINDLVKKCSDSYDSFLIECFKPFGITKDNILSWIDRIHKEEYSDLETDIIYHRYFIDRVYAFTVSVVRSIDDDHVFTQEHRRFIEEDLKKGDGGNGAKW